MTVKELIDALLLTPLGAYVEVEVYGDDDYPDVMGVEDDSTRGYVRLIVR